MTNNFNVPINKGNYTMETPERMKAFSSVLAQGWETEYSEYRKNWSEFPTKKIVSDYPLLVDIELSTACNLRCPMCYTITDEFKKKVKPTLMDYELFKKIIDEIAGKVPAIRLSLRGEPTLHPHFIDAIRYAKQAGIKEVSSLTNASNLTPEFIEQMVQAEMDWLTISVDGLYEQYENVRKPLKFNDTLEKIKNIKKIKEKYSKKKPAVKVQGIWPAIKNNPEEYYNTFSPYVDVVAFNPLIDYLSNDTDIVFEENFSCPQHYQRLIVGADGNVLMCSNDEESSEIIGNANLQTIHDIWHGEKLTNIRNLHSIPDGFKQIPVCKKCYLPRATEDSETACVNGHEFIIKNYVNRSQTIGT